MNYLQAQAVLEKFFKEHPQAIEATSCGVGVNSIWIKVPITHTGEYLETFEGLKVNIRYQDEPGEFTGE